MKNPVRLLPNDVNMDNTDWGVVLKQGRYWRPDIGKFLSDAEYKKIIVDK